jgi:hypothetical protein
MRHFLKIALKTFAGSAIATSSLFFSGCGIFPLGRPTQVSAEPVKIDPVLFRTEIFGEETSKPLENGYFIYKGRYIPPPYVIKRIGLSLHINDFLILTPLKWKSINDKVPDTLPECPDVGMMSPPDAIKEYISDTFAYYESLYKGPNPPKDKTFLQSITVHLKKLPNVWDAEVDEEHQLIRITTCNLAKFNVSSSTVFGLANAGISEDALKDMYHRAFEKHISYFKENKIVYKGLTISEIEWREDVYTFYEAVKILNSNSWKYTKRKELEKLGFASDKIITELLSVYKPSEELEKRLYEEYVRLLDNIESRKKLTPYDKFD